MICLLFFTYGIVLLRTILYTYIYYQETHLFIIFIYCLYLFYFHYFILNHYFFFYVNPLPTKIPESPIMRVRYYLG